MKTGVWALASFLLGACSANDAVMDANDAPYFTEHSDILLAEKQEFIARRNNAFAFGLLNTTVNSEQPDRNVLLSPLSASLALGLLNNGATGTTEAQIRTALGYKDLTRTELNDYFKGMIQALEHIDQKVNLNIGSSIWLQESPELNTAFSEINTACYNADIFHVWFGSEEALTMINTWLQEKTDGALSDFFNSGDYYLPADTYNDPYKDPYFDQNSYYWKGTQMWLLHTVCFNGAWQTPFDGDRSGNVAFTNSDGTTTEVVAMNGRMNVNFVATDELAMVELPYSNGSFSLNVLLPDRNTTSQKLIEQMTEPQWKELVGKLQKTAVDVSLPRFSVEYEHDLDSDISTLGMSSIFDATTASFGDLSSARGICVNRMRQKLRSTVNESGTSAATLSDIVTNPGNEPVGITTADKAAEFRVDRPFIYIIKEQSSGVIIFTGIVKKL
ncbi:MAG: hypothetical protein LBR06_03105 [Bacteroidales bacterium]|jgi:serpin B|nr:hypothetical protein [Bacteroidales bacterium]